MNQLVEVEEHIYLTQEMFKNKEFNSLFFFGIIVIERKVLMIIDVLVEINIHKNKLFSYSGNKVNTNLYKYCINFRTIIIQLF